MVIVVLLVLVGRLGNHLLGVFVPQDTIFLAPDVRGLLSLVVV